MKLRSRIWLSLIAAFVLFLASTPLAMHPAQAGGENIQQELTRLAQTYLKEKYSVLITGEHVTGELVAEHDGNLHTLSNGAERLKAIVKERQALLKTGMRYTASDISLTVHGMKDRETQVVLQATELTALRYTHEAYPKDAPERVTDTKLEHYFVFSKREAAQAGPYTWTTGTVSYSLAEDWIDKSPFEGEGISVVLPPGEGETIDDSSYCCYPEEELYNQPFTGPEIQPYGSVVSPRSCAYWGLAAAGYAYFNSLSYNPNYRVFDNDCTNFVSQSLQSGGWGWKKFGKDYKNWGFWWYNPNGSQRSGQTRSWTQAKALAYFVINSGRGFNTSNPCDLEQGDLIFADWNRDGMIDHVMVITQRDHFGNCADWSSIFLSQHTPFRRDKPLSQYAAEQPNAKFIGMWICHN